MLPHIEETILFYYENTKQRILDSAQNDLNLLYISDFTMFDENEII